MRPSKVYVIVTWIFISFALLLFIKHTGWVMKVFSVTTDDHFVHQNNPNTVAHKPPKTADNIDINEFVSSLHHNDLNAVAHNAPKTADNIDINEFISSQPHYNKLCQLDRYKLI